VNGVPAGEGSLVVEYLPTAKTVLQVEAEGFSTFRQVLEGVQEPALAVNLHRPLLWTHGLEAACEAPPLVDGKAAYVAGRDRFLTSISLADGATLWRVPLGLYTDACTSPVKLGDAVMLATSAGEVVCAGAEQGELRWRKPLGVTVESQPVAAGDVVVVVGKDGSVRALDAAGEARWTLPARTVTSGGAPTRLAAAADGGAPLVGWIDPRGTYCVVSSADGKPQHRAPTTAVLRGTPAAGADDRIWVYAEDESVRLLAASSGAALRRFPMPRALWDGPVALANDAAYSVASDGSVACFKASGDTGFRKRLEETPAAPCAVDEGFVYVPGSKGRLQVLDAASGELRWTYDAKAKLTARPVSEAGVVLVVTSAGIVHCLQR
jgi:outer membrane protein assembly factor BamB